MTFQKT